MPFSNNEQVGHARAGRARGCGTSYGVLDSGVGYPRTLTGPAGNARRVVEAWVEECNLNCLHMTTPSLQSDLLPWSGTTPGSSLAPGVLTPPPRVPIAGIEVLGALELRRWRRR